MRRTIGDPSEPAAFVRGRTARDRRLALAVMTLLVAAGVSFVTESPSEAVVLEVSGSATAYLSDVSLFGGPSTQRGPAGTPGCDPTKPAPGPNSTQMEGCSPTVVLPSGGSATPLTATDADGARGIYGPAVLFGGQWPDPEPAGPPSGPMTVGTQGSTGPTGSVSSSAAIALAPPGSTWTIPGTTTVEPWPGGVGPGPIIADGVRSTCRATDAGAVGSTTMTNAIVVTSTDSQGSPATTEQVPTDPPPNYGPIRGTINNVGDSFEVTYNEQIVSPGGLSITVNAVHMKLLGPTAVGDLYIAQSKCSVTGIGLPTTTTLTTPTTATTVAPTTTTSTSTSTTSTTTTLPPPPGRRVAAVKGVALGYHADNISLFGGAQPNAGPTPTVSLPPGGTATDPTGLVKYGPATLFTSDQIAVSSSGTVGEDGSASSSTNILHVNSADSQPSSGSEIFGYPPDPPNPRTSVASTCTASATGVSRTTAITNGILRVDSGWDDGDLIYPEPAALAGGTDEHDEVNVLIPTNPLPNTEYTGHIHLSGTSVDNWRIVFNEQVTNPDGSFTVNALHQYFLGSILLGDLIIGQSVCGVTLEAVHGAVADFDGNGATDLSVFRPDSGTWYLQGSPQQNFGGSGDIAVPADYDGDGRTDVAVFRPSNGAWYVKGSAGADTAVAFGASDDIPVPADYDGDAKADIAVFRGGVWYVKGSAGTDSAVAFGAGGDVPVPADYDGDGKVDRAVFRSGVWYVKGSAGTETATAFGTTGDVPVPGDYDGNGSADIAVFRPSDGVWFVQGGAATAWGAGGDVPVPGDFNGDGRADIAVFRPSNGVWYVQGGPVSGWGTNGDVPLPLPASVWLALR